MAALARSTNPTEDGRIVGFFGRLFGRDNHGTIHVQFFDADMGRQVAESHVPISQLPESFEAQTTVHVMDADWDIVEARPITAAEFRETGRLSLVLRRVQIESIDPATLLYSMPTICDSLPAVAPGSSKLGKRVIEIHEDDWRQIEWIGSRYGEIVQSELDKIRQISAHERQGLGFRRLHVRKELVAPFGPLKLSLGDLTDAIGERAVWLDGFGYCGAAGIVTDSFAVRLLSSVELYGVARTGIIQSICFAGTYANNAPQPDVRNLTGFAALHGLLLVDWCRAEVLPPTENAYAAFFSDADPAR